MKVNIAAIGFLVTTICICASLARGAEPMAGIVFDRADALNRISTHQTSVRLVDGAMRVEFARADWPHVLFEAGKAYEQADWSGIGAIVLDVRNPGAAPLLVNVRGDATADGEKFVRQGNATVTAGERALLVWAAQSAPAEMKGAPLPPMPAGARLMNTGGQWPAHGKTRAFQIFLSKPSQPQMLDVFSVRFLAKVEMNGIVDRFGQYAHADWPGKVHQEEELARARADEQQWLREHRAPADRDEFGGWKSGPQLKSTGFFRTERVDGRWWLVTPSGHLFWSVGATCVRPDSSGPIRGRESLFTWLPDGAARAGWVDFYQINLGRKYGESWKETWAEQSCARLPAWGFNTIANWSHESVCELHRVPFTISISFGGLPAIGVKPAPGKTDHRLHDFFDESFPRRAEDAIAKQTARWRDDPWCIGYFVHNELNWDVWSEGTSEALLARQALASAPTLAARQTLVKMLKEKYGTVQAFSRAWEINMTDWDQPITISAGQLNAAARADGSAFLSAIAQRYFSVIAAALKKHAPKQLYLGCRFATRPNEAVNVAAKYCDVVSFNIYRDTIDAEHWALLNALGKPAIIGEFHFGALDRGMFHTGLRPTASQAERAKSYAAYVRSAAAMPGIVGCHWFQYVDQALTGRGDGENYNIGLVNVADAPYPELRDAAREVNSQIYRLHGAASGTASAGATRAVREN